MQSNKLTSRPFLCCWEAGFFNKPNRPDYGENTVWKTVTLRYCKYCVITLFIINHVMAGYWSWNPWNPPSLQLQISTVHISISKTWCNITELSLSTSNKRHTTWMKWWGKYKKKQKKEGRYGAATTLVHDTGSCFLDLFKLWWIE